MFNRYFDEKNEPRFESLGKFRIVDINGYRLWYCSKFMYNPGGDIAIEYFAYSRYVYCGELVLTLVCGNKPPVTVIPERFLKRV